MLYYIVLLLVCILALVLYRRDQQNKKQQIQDILKQYMVLEDHNPSDEGTTL